ncbi:MAG: DUF938 domain-containing protein [Woeseiaceae bacterium]|nr:DUF938 domain-containing protein [Woeseiaceae bacterium]
MAAPSSEVPFAPAASRNTQPILDVLRDELIETKSVLEIGSGTGQHAVAFAAALPELRWQPSDVAENLPGIERQRRTADVPNILPAIELDVLDGDATASAYDCVYTANTLHIMSWEAVQSMCDIVGRALTHGGLFVAYGPFRRSGVFSTPSNAAFDESLRRQHPDMGIRELDDVDALLGCVGLSRRHSYAMPANNLLLAWEKHG